MENEKKEREEERENLRLKGIKQLRNERMLSSRHCISLSYHRSLEVLAKDITLFDDFDGVEITC